LVIWLDETDSPNRPLDLGICLPTVIVSHSSQVHIDSRIEATYPYPVKLKIENLVELPEAIDRAIALFLRLPT